jgi:hypothetical protein
MNSIITASRELGLTDADARGTVVKGGLRERLVCLDNRH